jgi:F-box/leucine-rich repeat protein 7
MYFIIRGSVFVTSRDGESYYAELRSGAYFGYATPILVLIPREIGVLFSVPRTANIIAQTRTLTLSLSASSLHSILPAFPPLALAMRHEAESRLAILKQQQSTAIPPFTPSFNLREAIGQLHLFRGLSENALHVLCMSVRSRTYMPFTNILVEGRAAPDREIYFIMQGDVEVLTETDPPQIKARLGAGQYFGELAFLDPLARRTATVRSVTRTTCLVLEGKAMREVTVKFPQVEMEIQRTAKERMEENELLLGTKVKVAGDMEVEGLVGGVRGVEIARDIDPFIPTMTDHGFETIEKPPVLRSRRSSLKPPELQSDEGSRIDSHPFPKDHSSLKHQLSTYNLVTAGRARDVSQSPTKRLKRLSVHTGLLPKPILLRVFSFLPLHEVMRLRLVSHAWQHILQSAPNLVVDLDLRPYNKKITDDALASISRFVNSRPRSVDISNCFHISDTGFLSLVRSVSPDLTVWRMKSVWDVTGQAISEIAQRCSSLEDIDLSNCRKVGDATLSRIVGNSMPPAGGERMAIDPPPSVKRLTLSYCKHLTDRFMAHLASNDSVASSLQALNLSRCTTITDWGFQTWSVTTGGGRFSSLQEIKLSDCTFLTDQAIVYLVNAAPNLQKLDLVFP